ncbi:MAG: putative redox protein [Anaerophaga sp.]|uniref:OsmC family protein n=1 Tax=Anaerophaga thermohalophila TaxID=177400 RepID=UPI000237C08C|nr:OsmC family protein [Anaerophaga thermohalophila]MDK2841975.1 putative redox protein [Anaerophaga sp.]MDN5290134.1 putative redox protein [Anaerophaga sp.]
MKSTLDLNWTGKMSFETEMGGHKVILDADPSVGGEDKGVRPKPLMLLSLAGCTAMDVISILRKMRVEVDDFNVRVEADMTEEHPKHYTKMHVIYTFKGKDLPKDKIEKAVSLSDEKYCGVAAVYRKALELTHEIRLED